MNAKKWGGVYPALLLPFEDDYTIDDEAFRRLVRWVVDHDGVSGVVVNEYTGEVNSLLAEERAEVVRIAVDELRGAVPVISGVSAEGTIEAVLHAKAAEHAGADAILLMPPHSWLRFGMQPESAVNFFTDVGAAVDLPLFVHQHPAQTKAAYSVEQLLELTDLPGVEAVEIGTREMSRYEFEVRALKSSSPDVAILTCHDEYLLPTLVQGIDGALVGFASVVPELVVSLVEAVRRNDLANAVDAYDRLHVLQQAVFEKGGPSASSRARMKEAMYQKSLIPSALARPPAVPISEREKYAIRTGLERCDLVRA